MLTITDGGSLARALRLPIDLRLKQLLIDRRDQLGGDITDIARFIVVQPADSLKAVEEELGFPGLSDPESSFGCEWVADHGDIYEAVWVLTDCGFAHVIFLPKQQGREPRCWRLKPSGMAGRPLLGVPGVPGAAPQPGSCKCR